MQRIKVVKDRNYTTINNEILKDRRITLKAKGLFSMIMALPDNWDFTVEGMTKVAREGRDALQSAIDELIEHGYCTREKMREEGRFMGYDYTFYEYPLSGKPTTEEPFTENPKTDNPRTDKPFTENPQQLSTDLSSTKTDKVLNELSNDELKASPSGDFSDQNFSFPGKTESEKLTLSAVEVIGYLNLICGKSYKVSTKTNMNFITARLKDGYTIDDLKRVIEYKNLEWANDDKMNVYLRPETLFNATKFQTYIQQVNKVLDNPEAFLTKHEQSIRSQQSKQPANSPFRIEQMFSKIDTAYSE